MAKKKVKQLENQSLKCDICGKMTAPKYGYGKVVCSDECFRVAGETYKPDRTAWGDLTQGRKYV